MSTSAVSVEMHVYPGTGVLVKTFDAAAEQREPFVVLQVGAAEGRVAFFVTDEEALNALASAVGEARAKLVGAITRAKTEQAGQQELPGVPVAS